MKRNRSDAKSTAKRTPVGAAVMQPRVTEALTRALFVEWARHGYGTLSMEAVAKRAGVGKAALYRRWPSKFAMVTERLETVGLAITQVADTGSLRQDVLANLRSLRGALRHRIVRQILADLHAEMARISPLAEKVRGRLQIERRLRAKSIYQRAIARGELSPNIDFELLNDLGAAELYWRLVVTGAKADDRYLNTLTDLILTAAGVSVEHRPAEGNGSGVGDEE
jgi:AcrR family transcriptional regulator